MFAALDLCNFLESDGIKARVVPVTFIGRLRERIEQDHRTGILPEGVYESCFTGIEYEPEKKLPGAKSIIVAAIPYPGIRNIFNWKGRVQTVLIPPIYTGVAARVESIKKNIAALLGRHGYTSVPAPIPKKYLAVGCGLGEYGRNNICYVDGFGSFHGLITFYTDLSSDDVVWREPVMMDSCRQCQACIENCPTCAIGTDRFQIQSDRCLTFFNENPGEFPDWVKGEWFDSLVGCLQCQNVCPENAAVLGNFVAGESFSEEETALLLSSPAAEQVPAETRAKLERLDLFYMEIIPRNLKPLFRR